MPKYIRSYDYEKEHEKQIELQESNIKLVRHGDNDSEPHYEEFKYHAFPEPEPRKEKMPIIILEPHIKNLVTRVVFAIVFLIVGIPIGSSILQMGLVDIANMEFVIPYVLLVYNITVILGAINIIQEGIY